MKPLFSILAWLCVLGVVAPAQAAPGRRSAGSKAYLGVALAPLTPLDRRQKKVPRYGGVLIQTVLRNTPAARAGFRPGDVIMRLNGKYVYKPADVIRRVARARVNTRVKVDIIRNGGWMMARVLLTARPRSAPSHVAPRRRPTPPRASATKTASRGAILKRLIALQREMRQLRKMIRELKSVCKRP
jgi:C-terminal processing protease CtpA/Prc